MKRRNLSRIALAMLLLGSFLMLFRVELAEVKAQSAPIGSITINSGDLATASPSVTLTLTVDDPDKYYSFGYNDYNDASTATWDSSFSPTRSWELLPGDGPKTVYYFLNDWPFGSGSLCGFDSIILDTTLPTGSIEINDGDAYTTSSTVTLTLIATDNVSGVSQIRLSNDGTWNSEIEEWGGFSSPKPWTLASGDGSKTVYYQIKDNAGLESMFSDTIVLDTVPPTGAILINNGDESTSQYSVTLKLTADDLTSGVFQVRYSNDGTWDTESWANFSSTKEWMLSSGEGSKTVHYQIKDRAELVSIFSDSIILESPSPTPISTPTPTSSSPPTPTPTPTTSQSPPPSGSPTPSSESWNGTPGVIPPGVFYATAVVGLASIAAIIFVTFRKPKRKEDTDDSPNVSSQP